MKNISLETNSPDCTFLKLLVFTPYCIYPAKTGGPIRVFELVHGLSKQRISVTVVMPITPAQFTNRKINENLFLKVVQYPFLLPFLFTGKPFSYNYLMSLHPGYHFFLKKYFKTNDIIQFEGTSFGDLVDYIPSNKIVVYDAHNVEYDYEQFESRFPRITKISTRRIHKLENKLVQRADKILTCSSKDAQRLSQLYGVEEKKCTTIPNGIHLHKDSPRITTEQIRERFPGFLDFPQRAIFSGSDVPHNREAVSFLIESVAPQLNKECAFIIKGQCGNSFKNSRSENIFLDPIPGNVAPYADACTVALNPVMQGSGTSLKVLDYLVYGLPVISTEFGMRGFEDLEKYVMLAKPEDFVFAIKKEQKFVPKIYRMLDKYSWTSITKTLSETLVHRFGIK
jgi:glycosyltransferase involved in cell wall biosynthesis